MTEAQLSPDAHRRLTEELAHRTGDLRREISLRIERAREHGDIRENADYDAAKNEQGLNEARVRQIEGILSDAVIVEHAPTDVVAAGTLVEIKLPGDGRRTKSRSPRSAARWAAEPSPRASSTSSPTAVSSSTTSTSSTVSPAASCGTSSRTTLSSSVTSSRAKR
jgi:transcription elongation GreA/GreB family factor